VTAQLINAEDGYHLWSERYDRQLTDVFAIQDDIAQAIAGALQLKLISNPARHTPAFPAYEALLKARHHARTYSPEAHARAEKYCRQAIALDPEYAAPHALLGFTYFLTTTHTGRPMPEVAPLVREEARRALELDPFRNRPAFPARRGGGCRRLQLAGSSAEFELAMASPSVPAEAHWAYACFCLQPFGRFEESTAEMRRVVQKDPLSVQWRGVLMANLVLAGKYEQAVQEGFKRWTSLTVKFTRIWHSAKRTWRWENRRSGRFGGESASQSPSALDGHRILAATLIRLEKRLGQRRSSER